jgi:hypothetical protein
MDPFHDHKDDEHKQQMNSEESFDEDEMDVNASALRK